MQTAGKKTKGVPRPARRNPVVDALRILVSEGLDNDTILETLGDADSVSSRAAHGFPIEVCEPETTLLDDGVLRWYPRGGLADDAQEYRVATLKKRLSEIRKSA